MIMKRNSILLVVLVLLSGLTIWLVTRDTKNTISRELRDFAIADTGSITKIFLADKAMKQTTLTKQPDGSWLVNGKYTARPDAVKILLKTMHEISVKEPVGLKLKPTVIKQLATGGTKVEVYTGDKLVKLYYVGSETQDMTGTYMLLADEKTGENSSEPFVMEIKGFNGYLTTRYFTSEEEWRDRTVFGYFAPDIRSIKVTHQGAPEQSFVVTQSAGSKSFGLQSITGQPLPFDTIAVKQYISYFNRIGFENFVSVIEQPRKDSIIRSQPIHTIEIMDAKGKKNLVKLYRKKHDGKDPMDSTATAPPEVDPDRMFALINDGKDFVVVQYFVFGKLLQTPAYFRRPSSDVPQAKN
jgi:hypothetical protein